MRLKKDDQSNSWDKMKDRARRGEAGQVTQAALIATQKEGRGLFPKNGHAGLFFESDLCSCPSSLRRRLDKSRTSCSCYGRKRRKCAVSLGRSLPAGHIGRTLTRSRPARCLLGTAPHVHLSAACVCVCWLTATEHSGSPPPQPL